MNLPSEVERTDDNPLEILIIGACDARHIIKSLSSIQVSPRRVNFHAMEATLEDIARSMLLINICLDKKLGKLVIND